MKRISFVFFLILLSCVTFSQVVPENKGPVSDYEDLFTPQQEEDLVKMLRDYEQETSIEIAILTVSDYESDISDFAQKTATAWKLGKKGIDNGLLIVISKKRGVLRTQTGYGLEGYLPDGWLKHTGDSIGIKHQADYYGGMIDYIGKCKERIGKEGYSVDHNKELAEKNKKNKKKKSLIGQLIDILPWWGWVLIVLVWIVIFILDPELAINILLLGLLEGGSSGGGSSGGGKFGGGGSSSKW